MGQGGDYVAHFDPRGEEFKRFDVRDAQLVPVLEALERNRWRMELEGDDEDAVLEALLMADVDVEDIEAEDGVPASVPEEASEPAADEATSPAAR